MGLGMVFVISPNLLPKPAAKNYRFQLILQIPTSFHISEDADEKQASAI